MAFLKLYSFVNIIMSNRPTLIKKNNLCINCKHLLSNNIECSKFGNLNVETGKKIYEYANYVRHDEKKCGKNGKYFEQINYNFITIYYNYIRYYLIFTPGISIIIFYATKLYQVITE